ncbi:MAG: serine/threonine protein kinase [Deltaproteobacteria bacterium]|nr:serine/threonine protein kinase [Deltaproteobacteria bacterium]
MSEARPIRDEDQRVGTTIDDAWTIERAIGVGATAVVYAARHRSGNVAAMKILRRDHRDDLDALARFVREAEVARKIRHPSIIEVWGLSTTDDGVPVIVMELLEGETLSQRLHRGPQPVGAAIALGIDILRGVAACHAQGVLHRDLKPSNVFVTTEGAAKLLDFGVARARDRIPTSRRMAIGTPAFMAPEQARGGAVDARADVFCVGAILHTLITGTLPRRGDEERVLATAAREGVRPLALAAPGVPLAVAEVVDKALSWSPESRWESATAFADALSAIDLTAVVSREQIITIPCVPIAMSALQRNSTVPEVLPRRPPTRLR